MELADLQAPIFFASLFFSTWLQFRWQQIMREYLDYSVCLKTSSACLYFVPYPFFAVTL